jgi:hypothetical protein
MDEGRGGMEWNGMEWNYSLFSNILLSHKFCSLNYR